MPDSAANITDDRTALRLLKEVKRRGGSTRHKPGVGRALTLWGVSHAARIALDLVVHTSRIRLDDPHGGMAMGAAGQGTLMAVWHHRLLGALVAHRTLFSRSFPSVRCSTLISESSDGEFIARPFRDIGGHCVRGSSSRRGRDALRGVVQEARAGAMVTLTPDGPRGPRFRLQDGIITAAQLSGRPIFPFTAAFSRRLCLRRSWDQFEVPLPFSRITLIVGRPVWVAKRLDTKGHERVRREVLDAMMEVTERADRIPACVIGLGKPKTPPASAPA